MTRFSMCRSCFASWIPTTTRRLVLLGCTQTEPLNKSGYACWAALQSINRRNTRYTTLRVFGAARQSAETGTVGPVLRPPCEARAWMEWHVPLQAVYLGERYGWSHTEDHEGLGY